MTTSNLGGKTALVTGASSGLGADFARELAALGAGLVIVARRADRLEALKREIEAANKVAVRVEEADLAAPGAARALHGALAMDGVAVDILVNNAGFGMHGKFLAMPLERAEEMLQVNVVAPTQLAWLFGNDMAKRGWGRILMLGSTGSYQATPTFAAYAATKGYDLLLGEALSYELRKTGVTCTVLCPGFTQTEFAETAGHERVFFARLTNMPSGKVARIGIRAMLRGRHSVVAGLHNALSIWFTRFTPRKVNTWLAGRLV